MRLFAQILLIATLQISTSAWAEDLASWNDVKSKQQIVDFVDKVTKEGSKDYVAPADRIAVFDNDGTLWTEQPYYFQLAFMLDRVKALAPDHPEWKTTEPFKSILTGDLAGIAKSGEKGVVELGMVTHAGMTTDVFNKIVTEWYTTAKHPKTGKPFSEMTFLPMRELLDYLRTHDFQTFIVSGGGVEFMRPMTEKAYGIPSQQVIGSSIKTQYAIENDQPVLKRLPEIDFIDDGPGKPVGINRVIGKRPIFVAGNSDGDYEMLRWGTASPNSLGIIVHHTDGDREYAYDRQSSFGKLDKALTEAPERNWVIVDMKNDWKKIYAFD
ncbi:HAD family hydrolase [Ochrobactrum teleogrylli]|uniref:Haloacid dehalogenase-like hydrolase n=1 Tax=Ochrobactrum teleogrylli TaxID=2479765 RepID=A0ABY2Y2V0_9HYPH|nr:HAD family hydrolase [[Ochrobactrum] teleogrylli]TNV14223.1 haloacid dehalogenase-like hydrolase [[Ochrobactrum] teleogrylli]